MSADPRGPAAGRPPEVAVVGAGVAGLAAALRLRDRLGPAARITVFDAAGVPGGKLRTGEVGGRRCETGAEAFLVRAPGGGDSAAVALARRFDLPLVHPAPVSSGLYVDGALRSLPTGTLLGIPVDPATVADVAAVDTDRDRDAGRPLLAPAEDVAVGALVRARLGDAVVDRLVDPLLGGVYAGRADALSLRATMPHLAAACERATTLRDAVRAVLGGGRAGGRPGGRVFATVPDGLDRLVEAMVGAAGASLRLGTPVRVLQPAPGGRWRLVAGRADSPETTDVDAVVLAVPAHVAVRLLAGPAPEAADRLAGLRYASLALVTLALPGLGLPGRSGFLVPATEGLTIKAATFFTRKWPHLAVAGEPALVRLSIGRHGDDRALGLTDPALVEVAHRELATVLGTRVPAPVAARVDRWGGALPQYPPGHPEAVAAARAALPPRLWLAGAGYDGVGVPACIVSGQTAADALVTDLG